MICHDGAAQVFLFGHGLVGHAIDAALAQATGSHGTSLPYDWSDAAQRATARAGLRARAGQGAPLSIVWAAGRAGFGSTDADMAGELSLLEEIVLLATEMTAAGTPVSFHLVSSAGGLFEGQRHVAADTAPAPQRPYGQGKQRQEQVLLQAAGQGGFASTVYRPSSVYGFVPGRRMGLITTLIRNTLQGQVTTLTGNTETLRDYVFAPDIGRFMAARILDGTAPAGTHLLASGLSVSIADIVARVTRVLNTEPRLQIAQAQDNAAHMSFAPEALPRAWSVTPLDDGIADCAALVAASLTA